MGRRNKGRYKQLPMPNNTGFKTSLDGNTGAYYMYFYRMVEIYMSRLKWNYVPDSIDIPTIMYSLLFQGNIGWLMDPVIGLLALPGTPSKSVDVYNYCRGYYIHTASGYNAHLNVSRFSLNRTGVVMYANMMRQPDILVIMEYAKRMADALRTCDVNIAVQKTMKIFGTTEEQKLTMENLLKDYMGNVPLCMVDKKIDLGGIEHPVYDLTSPYVADKVWVHLTNIWNDFLTWVGIENATNQKRERMVTDEVNANYGNVEMERKAFIDMIRIGIKDVNKLFGQNITVDFNSDLVSGLNMPMLYSGGSRSDGEIYNQNRGMGELSTSPDNS